MRRRRPHKLSRNTPRALHQADVNCVRAAADIANDGRVVEECGGEWGGSRSSVQTVKAAKESLESNIHPPVKVEVEEAGKTSRPEEEGS